MNTVSAIIYQGLINELMAGILRKRALIVRRIPKATKVVYSDIRVHRLRDFINLSPLSGCVVILE
jgi:hypothetical protein